MILISRGDARGTQTRWLAPHRHREGVYACGASKTSTPMTVECGVGIVVSTTIPSCAPSGGLISSTSRTKRKGLVIEVLVAQSSRRRLQRPISPCRRLQRPTSTCRRLERPTSIKPPTPTPDLNQAAASPNVHPSRRQLHRSTSLKPPTTPRQTTSRPAELSRSHMY